MKIRFLPDERALGAFRNQDEVARQPGISFSQLRRKIKDYRIEYLRERKGQKRSLVGF